MDANITDSDSVPSLFSFSESQSGLRPVVPFSPSHASKFSLHNNFQTGSNSNSLSPTPEPFLPNSWSGNYHKTPSTPSNHQTILQQFSTPSSNRYHHYAPHSENIYMQLQKAEHICSQLKSENASLQQQLLEKTTEFHTVKTAHDALLLSIAQSPALSSTIISYNTPRYSPFDAKPAHLKKVQFWRREEFILEKKRRKGLTGISREKESNTMTWYVQNENGLVVDADRVTSIRQRARALWQQLLRLGLAPVSWSNAGADAQDLYEYHMISRFPELSYCEDNWKVQMIATDNYSSWYADHGKASAAGGSRIKIETSPALLSTTEVKRRATSPPPDSLELDTKKVRRSQPTQVTNTQCQPIGVTSNGPTLASARPVSTPSPLSRTVSFSTEDWNTFNQSAEAVTNAGAQTGNTAVVTRIKVHEQEQSVGGIVLSSEPHAPTAAGGNTDTLPTASEATASVFSKVIDPLANLFDDTSLTDASPPTTTLSPPTATKTTPTATSAATHPDNQHTATLDVDHTPTTNRPAPPTVPPAHSIPPSGSGTSNQLPSSTIRPNNRKARAGTAMNAKSQCKRDWIKEYPEGQEHEFLEYWEKTGKAKYEGWKPSSTKLTTGVTVAPEGI